MANPDWGWFETDGTTANAVQSWTPLNGTPTTEIERRLYNDNGGGAGSVDSGDFVLTAISRPAGVGDYTMDDELAAGGYIEVRLTGSGGTGMVNQTTGWVRLGRGRYLRVKGIVADGYRTIEQRVSVPLGVGILAKDYKLRLIEDSRAFLLESGHTEGGAQGLRMGLGDASFTEILSGFQMSEAAVPDNTVEMVAGVGVYLGVPAAQLDETLTFNDEDSATDALASGEEYLALVTKDSDGATAITKSPKGTAPLSEANLPDTPDGHRVLGWVQVPFSAVITDAEIHQDGLVYGYAALVGSGLSPDVHPFEAIIGNALLIVPTKTPLSLTDDDVNYVWASPSGAVESNITGLQPEDMSQLIWEVTLASGVITVIRDCRQPIYPNPVNVTLYRQGTLAGAQVFYGVLPSAASAYLLPISGVVAAVGDTGSVSGSTKFDVLATDRNDTFTTIYTSSGTQDERPDIAHDATEPVDTTSIPEVYFFHGHTRFRGLLVNVPGTASVDGTIVLRFSAVGAA